MIDPGRRFEELQRAAALCDIGRYKDAAGRARLLLAEDPYDIDALGLLCEALLGDEDMEGALMMAGTAIAAAPDHDWPRRVASVASRRLSLLPEAIAHAREAVRLDPGKADNHAVLAQALATDADRLPLAREAAERAVSLAPDHPHPYLVLGSVAARIGDRSAAETAFRSALRLDPHSTVAHNELARLQLTQSGRFDASHLATAARGFAAAVSTDPKSQTARRNLDHVVRVFLSRVAYLIFLDAYAVNRLSETATPSGVIRLLPIALLVFVGLFVLRFVARLTPALRRHLWRLLVLERGLGIGALLETAAVGCVLAGALAPGRAQVMLPVLGAVAALAGRLVLWSHSRRHAPVAPEPAIRTGMLLVLAVGLGATAVVMVLVALRVRHPLAAVLVACALGAGAIWCLTAARGRRAATRGGG